MESVRERLDWFKAAILPHEGALRSRLRRALPPGHDIDDLVAETMTRAYANGDTTRTTAGRAYLFQIARNLLIDEARRDRIVSFEALSDVNLFLADHSAEAALNARDDLRHLQAILDTLPPQCRHAFIQRRVHDKSVGAIAEEMGLSVSTVDKHLTRAAAKIMQALGQYEDSGFGWSLQKRRGEGSARPGSRAALP